MESGDLPPNARRILDAARDADDPSAIDRARVDAAFAGRLRALGIAAPASSATVSPIADAVNANASAAASTTAATSAARAMPGGAGTASKIALALVGAGIVAVGLTRLPHASERADADRAASARPQSQAVANTEPSRGLAATPRVATSAAPASPTPIPIPTPPRAHETRARRDTAPSRRASEPTRVAQAPVPLRADTLNEEVALLETANAALRQGDFASALRALDAHQQRFAAGVLREERTGLRVLALCGLGDYAAGNDARRSFLREAPRSVLARKVRAACASSDDDRQGGSHD